MLIKGLIESKIRLSILSLPLMLSACSTGIEVACERSETPVVVNGERSDWTGNLAQSD